MSPTRLTGLIIPIAVPVGLSLMVGFFVTREDYDIQGSVLVALGMTILVGVFLIPRLARGPDFSFLLKLLLVAFYARMAGALVRAWTGAAIYGFKDVSRYDWTGAAIYGFKDVSRYDRTGEAIANLIRDE